MAGAKKAASSSSAKLPAPPCMSWLWFNALKGKKGVHSAPAPPCMSWLWFAKDGQPLTTPQGVQGKGAAPPCMSWLWFTKTDSAPAPPPASPTKAAKKAPAKSPKKSAKK
mgnify:CR=1